jgi:hypothetical protein
MERVDARVMGARRKMRANIFMVVECAFVYVWLCFVSGGKSAMMKEVYVDEVASACGRSMLRKPCLFRVTISRVIQRASDV